MIHPDVVSFIMLCVKHLKHIGVFHHSSGTCLKILRSYFSGYTHVTIVVAKAYGSSRMGRAHCSMAYRYRFTVHNEAVKG